MNVFFYGPEDFARILRADSDQSPVRIFHTTSSSPFALLTSRIYDCVILDRNLLQQKGLEVEAFLGRLAGKTVFIRDSSDQGHPDCHHLESHLAPQQVLERIVKYHLSLKVAEKQCFIDGNMPDRPGFEILVTDNSTMEEVICQLKDVAPTRATVLLQGETGTGKEVLAHIIHNSSPRRQGPFMAVNCGALPDSLLESELFGHEKGSFTGAAGQRIGKIEEAASGTLFLDEIESMSEAMQVRLLRVLQQKSLQRLGSNQEIRADFRLIAATNVPLQDLLESGRLRADLYYRLAVFPIHIPPLRERYEDISLFALHFLNRKKHLGRDYVTTISKQAMGRLLNAPWPGNIRELRNVMERALLLAHEPVLEADLFQLPRMSPPLSPMPIMEEPLLEKAFEPGITLKAFKSHHLQVAEHQYISQLLEYTGGRIGESARFAGISPRALYNKMRIYNLRKENYRQSEPQIPIGTGTGTTLQ